jgi:peptidyl-prolyl cis-trans isomerase A (cyclophilin A)
MLVPALVLALAQAPAAQTPAPETPKEAPPEGPVVALDITQAGASLGTVTIVLLPDEAPISVANFLEYLRSGHYDGTIFHRLIPDFMAQGGGFTPEMEERPTRPPIRNEARSGPRNSRGTVAMARTSSPNSATAQFFINVKDNHSLDFGIRGAGYAVFGRVIDGMEVVDGFMSTPTTRRGDHKDTPMRPVIIQRAYEVEPDESRGSAEAPEDAASPAGDPEGAEAPPEPSRQGSSTGPFADSSDGSSAGCFASSSNASISSEAFPGSSSSTAASAFRRAK